MVLFSCSEICEDLLQPPLQCACWATYMISLCKWTQFMWLSPPYALLWRLSLWTGKMKNRNTLDQHEGRLVCHWGCGLVYTLGTMGETNVWMNRLPSGRYSVCPPQDPTHVYVLWECTRWAQRRRTSHTPQWHTCTPKARHVWWEKGSNWGRGGKDQGDPKQTRPPLLDPPTWRVACSLRCTQWSLKQRCTRNGSLPAIYQGCQVAYGEILATYWNSRSRIEAAKNTLPGHNLPSPTSTESSPMAIWSTLVPL